LGGSGCCGFHVGPIHSYENKKAIRLIGMALHFYLQSNPILPRCGSGEGGCCYVAFFFHGLYVQM